MPSVTYGCCRLEACIPSAALSWYQRDSDSVSSRIKAGSTRHTFGRYPLLLPKHILLRNEGRRHNNSQTQSEWEWAKRKVMLSRVEGAVIDSQLHRTKP